MEMTKLMPFVAALLMVGLMAPQPARADFAYSDVIVTVATSKSFSVSLNGQAATNSDPSHPGTATAVMWFNSTDGNTAYVNATVVGADAQVGPYPACTTPIMVFKNTGTTAITLNVKLNNTIAGMTFHYNATLAAGSDTGTADGAITELVTAGSNLVTGLGLNNQTNMCVWGTFAGVAGGASSTAFNYTSS